MGRRTIKRRGAAAGRPSTFFLLALAAGVLFVIVVFVAMLGHK